MKIFLLAVVMMATIQCYSQDQIIKQFPRELSHNYYAGDAGMMIISTLSTGLLYSFRPEGREIFEIFIPYDRSLPAEIWEDQVSLMKKKRAYRIMLRYIRRCSR